MPDDITEEKPAVTFTITGEVSDFGRIDNAFSAFKREAEKLLTAWRIVLDLHYEEKTG